MPLQKVQVLRSHKQTEIILSTFICKKKNTREREREEEKKKNKERKVTAVMEILLSVLADVLGSLVHSTTLQNGQQDDQVTTTPPHC